MVDGLAAGRGWQRCRAGLSALGDASRKRWLALVLPALLAAQPAAAQIGSERYSSFVMDARTGQQLGGANPDAPRYPASLTKMMTLYMLFDAMREGRITMDSRIYITEEASSRSPSKLGVPPGMTIPVEVAIYALTMKSANDVAVAVGEALGGSEERFAQMMTMRARQLGMTSTTFRNASGLPDWDQTTTARDMATLGRRLFFDFPERWHYFGNATIRAGNYAFRNHNHMLSDYEGVDGVKTGFINASGFNNVISAQRQGQRVFVSVFGGSSWMERDRHAALLLDDGFSRLGVAPSPRMVPEAPVAMARTPLIFARARAATIEAPRAAIRQVSLRVVRPVASAAARGRSAAAAARAELRPLTAPAAARNTAVRTRRVMEQGDGGRVIRVISPVRRQGASRKER
ncbi:D-alanyl-D-alanine carboxypeptidase family protein [Muricoccus aerilatus]|uniref:D-alanyl-D-alanine carboxypeptidase family protein n=1 Tax=Muricoccus aerilatus TaxID=452982 RepID=UPI000693C827|nr:D-alanyl-D-alanine carboxypeptidase family protein [Roseomonas aerilata]